MQDENVSVLPMIYFPSVPGFNFLFERGGEQERLGWTVKVPHALLVSAATLSTGRPATDRPRLVYQRREAAPEGGPNPLIYADVNR